MKYKFEITETLQKMVEIEAKNIDEAYRLVKEKYYNEEIILSDVDYIDTTIDEIFDYDFRSNYEKD